MLIHSSFRAAVSWKLVKRIFTVSAPKFARVTEIGYTETRTLCFLEAVMKNVTIAIDEDLYRLTRVEAAKAGVSMSKYMGMAAKEKIEAANSTALADKRSIQLKAIEAFLSGPKWSVMEDGRMPTADERNAR
jgi:hypothetical protein